MNFWFIPGWRDLLRRTGNTKLWGQKKNMAMFKSAKDELEHLDRNQELHMLMQEMQLQGKVLEQEAVYLHNDLQ